MAAKRSCSFPRLLFSVLFLALCMSFIDDELFLNMTSNDVISSTDVVEKNKTASWAKATSSLLDDWKTKNSSVSSVLSDWGVNSSSWDDWEDWFPSSSATNSSNGASTSNYWSDWGRFFAGADTSKEKSNKTWTVSWDSPKVSIVVDFHEQDDDDQSDIWLSRMAFAKMLQLEARILHGIDTELVVVGGGALVASWSSCFPGVSNEIKIVPDMTEFRTKEVEQEQWLGEMAILLEVSPDVWQDGLYLLQQHYRSKAARYASDISLPFLRVSDGGAPSLSDWKHVDVLIEFLRIKSDCCTLPPIKLSEATEKETVVNLQYDSSSSPSIQPSQLLQLLHRPKWTKIVLMENEPDGSSDAYSMLLQNERSYVIQSIHGASTGGFSMASRYCLLQQAGHELIGSFDSPASVWAALTMASAVNSSVTIRLFSEDKEEITRQQKIKYPAKDPRSRIRVEALPTPQTIDKPFSEYKLGTSQRPLSLVVQLAGTSMDNMLYAYALQYLLRQSYDIETDILFRRQEVKWIRINGPIKKCFPFLANLDVTAAYTDQFNLRRQQQRSLGLAQSFEILTSLSLREKLVNVQQLLRNMTSVLTPSPLLSNATVRADEALITIPFMYLGENAQVQVDNGFRSIFDIIFAHSVEDCPQYGSNETLWAKVADGTTPTAPIKLAPEREYVEAVKPIAVEDGTSVLVAVEKKQSQDFGPVVLAQNSLGSPDRPITIVIHLSGEMANNLAKLAYGYSLMWMLKEDYNITANVLLRHQLRGKWKNAMISIRSCFPNVANLNFGGANTPEYDVRLKQKQELYRDELNVWCGEEHCIRNTIAKHVAVLTNATNLPAPNASDDGTITMPFIETNVFSNFDYFSDRYYEQLRSLFQFDDQNPRCCSEQPAPDETLFHYRGFLAEMPKKGIRLGFEELSPNKTANEILGNRKPGDKIAILSRFPNACQPYVDAMTAAGFVARVISTSNGEQSFCFLMSGHGETIGCAQSTYAMWAAYLGNASKARLYSLKSPARTKRLGGGYAKLYNFTNPLLRQRISLESINSEQQDLIERNHR